MIRTTYSGPHRNVFEALGCARVTVEDGKVVSIEKGRLTYCPLFKKYRDMGGLDENTIRENIEFRIRDFGFCTDDRVTRAPDTIAFGTSETLNLALKNGKIDLVCFVADGCGSAMTSDPEILQGMCGRISGVMETYPVEKVIRDIGPENVLDPETARIDPVAMARIASERCSGIFAVTVGGPKQADVAEQLRSEFGDRVLIYGCHTSALSGCDAERLMKAADVVTACASGKLREIAESDPDILIAGNKVPMYAISDLGKELVLDKLRSIGKEPWDGKIPRDDPVPLFRIAP